MKRPRWHDFVIVFSIVALAVAGIGAIWGDSIVESIDGLMHSEEGPTPAESGTPTAGGTHKDLL